MNVKPHYKNATLGQRRGRRLSRRGYTLLELVISAGSATVLLGGLMSTIVVANRAWSPDLKPAIKTEASGLTRQLSIDLKSALYFTERTTEAVTFAVPDRDSDGQPEMLRYAWSGTAGEPLTVELNGGAAQVVVADVQTFNMDFLTRTVTAPVIPANGKNEFIVLISSEDGEKGGLVELKDLAKENEDRAKAIESWGFTVAALSKNASDADWNEVIGDAAAVYVPGSVADDSVGERLYSATVGVVYEIPGQSEALGFARRQRTTNRKFMDLENNVHYITETLPAGTVKIVDKTHPLMKLIPPFAPDLQVLARGTSNQYIASLAIIEAQSRSNESDVIPGRRVLLPWGASVTNFNDLTDEALTIMERSITWAANLDEAQPKHRVLYFVNDIYAFDARDFDRKLMFESAGFEVRLLNESSSSDVLTDEIANSSAIYLTARSSTDLLLSAVANISQGIICEGYDWTTPLGFASKSDTANVANVDIQNDGHPIVDGLSGDPFAVTNEDVIRATPDGQVADGAQSILQASDSPSPTPALLVIEKGAQRLDETGAPGRRTLIAYPDTLRSDLTADGYQLFQQAMDWTTQEPEPVVVESAQAQAFRSFLGGLFGR